jgi:streptogramin lyase
MEANRLERRSPTGVITYLSFPDAFTPYVDIRQLASGSGGTIWFTSDLGLGEVSPSGAITRFALTHKLTPLGITRAPDGDMWFTSTVASEAVFVHDYIGRITPSGGLKLFRIPTLGSEPKSITVGRDGNLWFAERGAIERLTPRGRFTRFPIGIRDAQPGASPPAGTVCGSAMPASTASGSCRSRGRLSSTGRRSRTVE